MSVVLFFVLQATLNLSIQRDWLPVRDPVYLEKIALLKQHEQFFQAKSDQTPMRVLALGSSRTHLGFDAGRFAKNLRHETIAFNFATSGGGPVTNRLYLERLLKIGVQTDWVLLEIHPTLLAPVPGDFESRWLQPYRLKPGEPTTVRELGWAIPDPAQHGWRGWACASSGYKLGILNHCAPVLLPTKYTLTVGSKNDAYGYVAGIDILPQDRPRALKASFSQYAECFPHESIGGCGPNAIRETIRLAQSRGIRIGLYISPESSQFRAWYKPTYIPSIEEFTTVTAREFDIPVFNLHTAIDDAGFADGHHMNVAGAEAFTDLLTERIRGLR
jgi:hypothetical protein